MENHTPIHQLDNLLSHIEGAYAPNTIRAYRADMLAFIHYCDEFRVPALPAQPSHVADFLVSSMGCASFKSSTLRRRAASISAVHRLSNLLDPTKHPDVKLAIRKVNRQLGTQFSQAFALTRDNLDRILKTCDAASLRGKRDLALLQVAYDSMTRRSELVSLRVEDIEFDESVGCIILLRRGKSDQTSNGRYIALGQTATTALRDWLAAAQLVRGPIFRAVNQAREIRDGLHPGQVARIFKRLAKVAGYSDPEVKTISGHSLRVGRAQDLLASGASMPQIMLKGGWSKTDTVMRYVARIRSSTLTPEHPKMGARVKLF